MKQTAVEWLINELQNSPAFHSQFFKEEFKQAKEMEKQQGYSEEDIKNAFFEGWIARDGDLPFSKAKNKWFNEFKKEIRL